MLHRIDKHQFVHIDLFRAGDKVIRKETIISATYRKAPTRVSYALEPTVKEMREATGVSLHNLTRSFPKLSQLCRFHKIDPVAAAFPHV